MPDKQADSKTFGDLLIEALRGHCELSPAQVAHLEAHYTLLQRWNARMNLTSIRSMEAAVVRHYAESVFLGNVIREDGSGYARVIDLGSGAGFPGVPVAVVLPEATVTLVEANHRKAAFLKESTRALPNIEVLARRSEEVNGLWDWLVSRAVRTDEVVEAAVRLAFRIGLLTAPASLSEAVKGVRWRAPIQLPWSAAVVVVGDVPRET